MNENEQWTHLVVDGDRVVGCARDVVDNGDGLSSGFVQLFGLEDLTEYGAIETERLVSSDHFW